MSTEYRKDPSKWKMDPKALEEGVKRAQTKRPEEVNAMIAPVIRAALRVCDGDAGDALCALVCAMVAVNEGSEPALNPDGLGLFVRTAAASVHGRMPQFMRDWIRDAESDGD